MPIHYLHLTLVVLILTLTSPAWGAYPVLMQVSLPMGLLSPAETVSFRTAVASTASVQAEAVTVLSVASVNDGATMRRLLRRLLGSSIHVSFQVDAATYEEASGIGIRLKMAYLNEDLNANGLPVATLVSGPTFATHDYGMLSCVGCPEGQYLDTTCRSCPFYSSTEPRVNAPGITSCLCQPGYTPTLAPSEYVLTYDVGSGLYAVGSETRPVLRMMQGQRTQLSWPSAHPFRISTENQHKGVVYAGFVDEGDHTGYVDIGNDAPQFLYYYCDLHYGMGVGVIQVVDDHCDACGIGFYKPTLDNTTCLQCVQHTSTRDDNSSALADCLCVPGYFLKGGVCTVCDGGTYKHELGNQACLSCPDNSDSDDNADAVTDCLCNLGYIGPPGGPCAGCLPGSYRSDPTNNICDLCREDFYNELDASTSVGDCLACPANTQSEPGSGSSLDCVCDPGYAASRAPGDSSWTCTPCTAGFYAVVRNSSVCSACGAGTYSTVVAATTADVCLACPDGYYTLDTGNSQCTACAPNTWQDLFAPNTKSSACQPCPGNSTHNVTASTNVDDCVCDPGFYKVMGDTGVLFTCEVCLAGDYCLGDNTRLDCPINHWSYAGSSSCTECADNSQGIVSQGLTTPEQCQCIAGFEGNYDSLCTECPAGMYQDLDYTFDTLQTHLRININADSLAVEVTCQYCPADTFCHLLGQSVCFDCPDHTESNIGSDEQTDCTCIAGYVGPNGGPCALCSVGFFCAGGELAQQCRLNSNSSVGAQSQADCVCNPGWYSTVPGGTCLKCPPDSFCPGNQTVTGCSSESFSPPGASSITECWCNEGKWRGCILTEDGRSLDANGADCDIDYTLGCVDCGENDICRNNTLLHCPKNSTAPGGSHDTSACVCVDGFYNVAHDPDDHDHGGEVDHGH